MPGLNDARRSRRRAVTLVPLAIASAAITAQVAVMGGPVLAPLASPAQPAGTVFDPIRPTVPQAAIEAPASLSAAAPSGSLSAAEARKAASDATASSIPSAALAAYQRADVVINDADAVCGLPWELVAAIGRVESNHGSYGGSSLDANGVATPGIYGIALDGTRGTQAIADTDAGRYDRDTTWDRAVGPMQFIPSTWSQVGVDGDGDGRRDPQDIDDAALASAVYLCAGDDDLSSDAGRRAAVFRYNHSTAYVDLVLSIMDAYMAGDWSASGTTAASTTIDDPTAPVVEAGEQKPTPTQQTSSSQDPTTAPAETSSADPTRPPTDDTPTLPSEQPVSEPTPIATQQPTSQPSSTPTTKPSGKPTPTAGPLAPVLSPVAPVIEPVVTPVLSITDALDLCGREISGLPDPLGLGSLLGGLLNAKQLCADKIVGSTVAQATALIPNTLRGLLVWVGLIRA